MQVRKKKCRAIFFFQFFFLFCFYIDVVWHIAFACMEIIMALKMVNVSKEFYYFVGNKFFLKIEWPIVRICPWKLECFHSQNGRIVANELWSPKVNLEENRSHFQRASFHHHHSHIYVNGQWNDCLPSLNKMPYWTVSAICSRFIASTPCSGLTYREIEMPWLYDLPGKIWAAMTV